MKKVSTVAAKPSKKMSQQKVTIGLDLGDRNNWYCVLDESMAIGDLSIVAGRLQLCRRNW